MKVEKIRDKILRERGLIKSQDNLKHRKRLNSIVPSKFKVTKTPAMILVERAIGIDIVSYLQNGSLNAIVKDIRLKAHVDIDRTTISRWKMRIAEEIKGQVIGQY